MLPRSVAGRQQGSPRIAVIKKCDCVQRPGGQHFDAPTFQYAHTYTAFIDFIALIVSVECSQTCIQHDVATLLRGKRCWKCGAFPGGSIGEQG